MLAQHLTQLFFNLSMYEEQFFCEAWLFLKLDGLGGLQQFNE
jgi:hypothetical protein